MLKKLINFNVKSSHKLFAIKDKWLNIKHKKCDVSDVILDKTFHILLCS